MNMRVKYIGDLECESQHLSAQATIKTGAPIDNHGKGDAFSPTDLLAVALAQCALITIAIVGKDKGIDIQDSFCNVSKIMSADKPRRITEIHCDFHFIGSFTDEQKTYIQKIAGKCPVYNSLDPEIKKIFNFTYQVN